MPIIWPYYNPREFHSADVAAMSQLEDARQMDEKIRMAQEEQRQKMEAEATRQAGIMKYQQLRASGVAPEAAWSATAGAITTGGGLSDFATGTHYLGTSPKAATERPMTHMVGGNLMQLDPMSGEWKQVVAGPEKIATQKLDPLKMSEYRNLLSQQSSLELAIRKEILPKAKVELQAAKSDVQARLKLLENELRGTPAEVHEPLVMPQIQVPRVSPEDPVFPIGGPIAPTSPVSTFEVPVVPTPRTLPTKEVIRVVNGRRAIFDATTKQFIRYAD